MSRPALRWAVCGLAAALVALTSAPSRGQEKKDPPKVTHQKAKPSAERASGVIIKAEPVAASRAKGNGAGAVRLTINTSAVWRDWARDQATPNANQSPRKAAERGANSVATKGEPETKDDLVVIQVVPESRVETRFRTLLDETSKGAPTPDQARADAGQKDPAGGAKTRVAKPVRFTAADLKPGLFI